MTPLQHYQALLKEGKITEDPAQLTCVLAFENLYHNINARAGKFARFWGKVRQKPVKGLYLWGGVGRGKTFLMDLFYHSLAISQKTRLHFHRFMHMVHQSLKEQEGSVDPLVKIAKVFARRNVILCFDELYVSDIADAMILSALFKQLFLEGVTLVATSNIRPEDLYANGLQRDKFLPAIELIKMHTTVIPIAGDKDFRLQYLGGAQLYQYPSDKVANDNLYQYFQQLSSSAGEYHKKILINERPIDTYLYDENVAWFTFDSLCNTPRSVEDYIEIARCFHTVILSDVKRMSSENENAARRFVALVDEFYERHVTLIISAQVPITSLYHGRLLTFEFQRTMSRLIEMQSQAYLAKPHI